MIQWPKEKGQKDNTLSTKQGQYIIYKTLYRKQMNEQRKSGVNSGAPEVPTFHVPQ
jgi:hypothetical protein